jgi:hypothetical protein
MIKWPGDGSDRRGEDAVATGDARSGAGRRDNGLVAAEYAVAGDVDPRLGEHLLDVLALQGIAAYLRPSTDLHPVTRTTTLPALPTDRLYVDRVHLDVARGYVEKLRDDEKAIDARTIDGRNIDDPGIDGEQDMDAAWAAIVAGYHQDRAAGAWPASEDVTRDGEEPPSRGTTRAPRGLTDGRSAVGDDISLLDGLDRFGAGLPDEDDDGYDPPPPPPLPIPALPTLLASIGIGAGFLLVLWPDLLPIGRDSALLLGFAGIIAGFVTLVWRLRPGDEEDDVDHGDGAKV